MELVTAVPRIVCCGEVMLELSSDGLAWTSAQGRGTANVAIHLARFGPDVALPEGGGRRSAQPRPVSASAGYLHARLSGRDAAGAAGHGHRLAGWVAGLRRVIPAGESQADARAA